jgi:hypothetical protein
MKTEKTGLVQGSGRRNFSQLYPKGVGATSGQESEILYLAEDIVRVLRQVGARAIYATHLHELAMAVEALNASVPGESRIVSAVSSPIDTGSEMNRNYRLEIRPPLGQSYAREIAAHYGISCQQLKVVLYKRGVL